MSDDTKLSDLLDEIGSRLPADKIPNIIPVVNRAIMILAKRLYVLESDLVTDELAMSIFASVAYTASTIAFVSGGDAGPDTITDSSNQFVVEGFVAGMPIYTNCVGNTGTVKIESVTDGTITLRSTDKVTATVAGSSYTITSRDNYGYLPANFLGFLSKPYIQGTTQMLTGPPNKETEIEYSTGSAGLPCYQKLRGDRLKVIPGTSANIVIEGDYWVKPTKLTTLDDYVPFSGLFDDVIQDYIVAVLMAGPSGTVELKSILLDAVDLIVKKREKKAPTQMAPGINWEDMRE